MPDALKVELSLTAADKVLEKLERIAQGFRDINKQMQQAGGGGGGGGRTPRTPRQSKPDPSFWDRLQKVFTSSRISFKGGSPNLMPMVGQLMKLLGPEATAAAAAIVAMGAAAKAAADNINEFRKQMFVAGGDAKETARLQGLSAISGSDAAKDARDFYERISPGGDPMAQAAAGAHGIMAQGLFGDLDAAKVYLAAIHQIRQMDYQEALRFARISHHDELMAFRDVSEETMRDLEKDAEIRKSLMTPEAISNAANFNAQMGRVKDNFSDLTTALGQVFMPMMTKVMKLFADLEHGFTLFLNNPFVRGVLDTLFFGGNKKQGEKDKDRALKDNTDAVNANTYALQGGVYGGGMRAKGAVPAAWAYNTFAWNKLAGEAAKLGAFTL